MLMQTSGPSIIDMVVARTRGGGGARQEGASGGFQSHSPQWAAAPTLLRVLLLRLPILAAAALLPLVPADPAQDHFCG
jgi:hypothetical protein